MKSRVIFASLLSTLLSTTAAFAHATFSNEPVAVGAYVAATLQVPHGCDGKATNEVHIKLPEGFIAAKPMPKAGWDIEVIEGDYKNSYDNHGTAVTSGPVEIQFKNGDLPDNFYDTFVIYGKVAAGDPAVGLAFPTVQLCSKDGKVSWEEIAAPGQDPHSLKGPAPVLSLIADDMGMPADHAGMGHGAMDHGAMDHAAMGHGAGAAAAAVDGRGFAPVEAGDLVLTAGFTKAMLPGQPVGGGFVTVENKGSVDDRLVGASSDQAGEVQLHEMAMQGDVMKMRQIKDGIAIPAGKKVELAPGGFHMMFYKVAEPFAEGKTVKVTLHFEKAGDVEVVLPVVAR